MVGTQQKIEHESVLLAQITPELISINKFNHKYKMQ